MNLILQTAPAAAVLSTSEARARCNIGTSVADATIDALVSAATGLLDGYAGWLGRALITQTWTMTLPGFYNSERHHHHHHFVESLHRPVHSQGIRIPLPPLQSLTSITYYDTNGVLQTLDPSLYRVVDGTFATVFPVYGQTWPAVRTQEDAVTLRFVCGYGIAGANVPEPIRAAVALQVSYLSALSRTNPFLTMDRVEGVGEKRYQISPGLESMNMQSVRALVNNYRVAF